MQPPARRERAAHPSVQANTPTERYKKWYRRLNICITVLQIGFLAAVVAVVARYPPPQDLSSGGPFCGNASALAIDRPPVHANASLLADSSAAEVIRQQQDEIERLRVDVQRLSMAQTVITTGCDRDSEFFLWALCAILAAHIALTLIWTLLRFTSFFWRIADHEVEPAPIPSPLFDWVSWFWLWHRKEKYKTMSPVTATLSARVLCVSLLQFAQAVAWAVAVGGSSSAHLPGTAVGSLPRTLLIVSLACYCLTVVWFILYYAAVIAVYLSVTLWCCIMCCCPCCRASLRRDIGKALCTAFGISPDRRA